MQKGTFDDPVWTMTEVGEVYLGAIIIGSVFIYYLLKFGVAAMKEWLKVAKYLWSHGK